MSRKLGLALMAATALSIATPLAHGQTIKGTRQAEVLDADKQHFPVAPPGWKAPKTSWGVPDLQGLWSNATVTTLERQPQYGDRSVMTPEEIAKVEGAEAALRAEGAKATDPNLRTEDLPASCGRGFTGANCGYNSFWTEPGNAVMRINGEARTSFLVEPKSGRLPAVAPEAIAARNARPRPATGPDMGRGDNPESLTLAERCLKDFGSSSGPPMMPLLYNNTYQIVQTPTDVMILTEMVHDVRIVHLVDKNDSTRHRPNAIRQWMGDAIGWYEGDTLVVETANFRPGQGFRGVDAPIVEKFTRVNDMQIKYSFEINDPKAFVAPVKAEMAWNSTKGPLYEYGCHEGNYAMPHILAGERKADEEAAAKAAAEAKGGKKPAPKPAAPKPQ